jgi:hypothetical protein
MGLLIGAAQPRVRTVYLFTPASSTDTFSGVDSRGYVLKYDIGEGFLDVVVNGAVLPPNEVEAINGTSVKILSGAVPAGVPVVIVALGVVGVANTYSQPQSDARYAKKAGDSMTGDLTFALGKGLQSSGSTTAFISDADGRTVIAAGRLDGDTNAYGYAGILKADGLGWRLALGDDGTALLDGQNIQTKNIITPSGNGQIHVRIDNVANKPTRAIGSICMHTNFHTVGGPITERHSLNVFNFVDNGVGDVTVNHITTLGAGDNQTVLCGDYHGVHVRSGGSNPNMTRIYAISNDDVNHVDSAFYYCGVASYFV